MQRAQYIGITDENKRIVALGENGGDIIVLLVGWIVGDSDCPMRDSFGEGRCQLFVSQVEKKAGVSGLLERVLPGIGLCFGRGHRLRFISPRSARKHASGVGSESDCTDIISTRCVPA